MVYATLVLVPLVAVAVLSLFEWDGLTVGQWVGLDNYGRLIGDRRVINSLLHVAAFWPFYCLLPISIGLLLAVALSRTRVRGRTFFRTVLFLPVVITSVVTAVIWAWIYAPDAGLLNSALRGLGLGGVTRPWLGDFDLALPAVGSIGTWVTFGIPMVLFVSGIQRIPIELYEAVRIDGGGFVAETTAVTIPGLRFEIAVAAVVTSITAFRNFDIVFNTTRGGPGTATNVPALEIFRRAFEIAHVGEAAALGVVLAVLVLGASLTVLRVVERGR